MNKFKCQKLQRAITPSKLYKIPPKVNQVIYTSSQISIPNIKALAKMVSKKKKLPRISKGHNSSQNCTEIAQKLIR